MKYLENYVMNFVLRIVSIADNKQKNKLIN